MLTTWSFSVGAATKTRPGTPKIGVADPTTARGTIGRVRGVASVAAPVLTQVVQVQWHSYALRADVPDP
eukprot:10645516-Lingulodinium_polyedra.AAC.1